MYITSPAQAAKFIALLKTKMRLVRNAEAWVAPGYTLLPLVAGQLKKSKLRVGAQSVSAHKEGAHTGEISASMLKNAGASFVIVGHSECRAQGDTDERVHEQVLRALEAGLMAVVCVGETTRDHADEYFSIIAHQLEMALRELPKGATKKIAIAYEPVWAIGKTASSAITSPKLQEMHIFIRKTLTDIVGRQAASAIPILYGGSVESSNARELLKESGVSGFLVGHASVEVPSFIEIINACKK